MTTIEAFKNETARIKIENNLTDESKKLFASIIAQPQQTIGIFASLPSGRLYAASTDISFRGHEGDHFQGGLDGEDESELVRLAKDGEHLALLPPNAALCDGTVENPKR